MQVPIEQFLGPVNKGHLCICIPIVECFKYLGVTISKNLSWSQNITNTVRTSKQQLGLLHRTLKDASQQSKHTIYRSTVLPKLEYCAAVWDPHQSTLTKKLENTQSFACKIINGNLTISLYLTNSNSNHLKTAGISKNLSMLQNHQQQILYFSHCLLTPPIIPFSPPSAQPNTLYTTCGHLIPQTFLFSGCNIEMELFTNRS